MSKRHYILSLLLCLTSIAVSAHTYTPHSVLSSGKWVKMSVTKTGMHYLTYDELQHAGLNPQELRIYGYGGGRLTQNFQLKKIDDLPQVPYFVVTGSDGVFNSGDYVVFYAQGLEKWEYNGARFSRVNHPYSTKGYYFLSDNAGVPLTIQTATVPTGSASYTANTYSALRLHEVDSINLIDRTGKEGGGREFYQQFPSSGSMSIRFSFPDMISTAKLKLFANVAAYSSQSSNFMLTLNGQTEKLQTLGISTSDFYTMGKDTQGLFLFNPALGENQDLTIRFTSNANGALGFLNYVEAEAMCSLVLRQQPLPFRNVEHFGSKSLTEYTLNGADSEVQVWNVTNLDAIQRVNTTLSGTSLKFMGYNETVQEFIAFKPSMRDKFFHPTILGTVPNQDLHSLQDIDMVILTNEAFLPAAQTIAAAHERLDGLTTAVVTDEQVYNEFSSGTPDATAYRWIMKMLYDRAHLNSAIHAPQYLLLMGDGTFDNRKLLAASGNNWLLTYQAKNSLEETYAYATDDYFGFLDDNEGETDISGRMDIAVGRFPVNSLAEAEAVVAKTIDYIEHTKSGKWKNQLVFLADDGDSNQHTRISDESAELVRTKNPDFVVNKVYLDAYPQETSAAGESYPLAKNKFHNLLATGVLFFDYSGHGGYNAITSESIMTLADITAMNNQNRGLWLLVTCNFSSFDAGMLSAGEEAVLNPDGGAIATISSCRTVFATQNGALNQLLCDTLFAHSSGHYTMTIGKALQYAKNKRGGDNNKMPYILLGDPSVRLAYPDDYSVVTTTNLDTLNALSIQTVEGYIRTDEGTVANWFNGRLSITVLDKMQQITTLDNDHTESEIKTTYTYNDYPSPLFKGEASVVDGRFSYTFMVPKDIRYNYGNGRIVYYAIDSLNAEEAIGHYEDFMVGGSSTVTIIDTIGPDLELYLNTPSFRDGGTTYEYPHFFANIADEHGINTAGSGIGHDLLLTIDNDPNQAFIVNDYFSASNGSYQAGTVSYALPEMIEGPHSLTFRAWDLLNNSSTRSLNFQVVKGQDAQLCAVMTYPNPVKSSGNLNIVIDYDQPDRLAETDLYVYDLTGKLIYHTSQKGAEPMTWNLGNFAMRAGVYVYKVQIQVAGSKASSKQGKIIVTE